MARAETIKKPLGKSLGVEFTVRFTGTYKAGADHSGAPSAIKPYDITVKMDHSMLKEHGALSAFKNYIAPEVMPLKYPDYQEKGLVTYKVLKSRCDNPELLKEFIALLDYPTLVEFVRENEYPITAELYEDAPQLIQAIMDFEADPDGYTKVTEPTRKHKHGGKLRDRTKARNLNSNFDPNYNLGVDDDDVEGFEVTKKPTNGRSTKTEPDL